ncbi:dihydrofolate reductase [Propionivibrio limicola]|uniref:dihydrofolate reductase n=1 Tax=Propionivibrio limicola TaxID=167645 RepID=UPI001292404F|nr:dihydrofolate reductase [Propionivibrio limicola]
MQISLIAAVANHRVIGKNNRLLWQLPEDMRHFRTTTRGKPVIMGRKTWESLPDAFRPLPGRLNIVVSRNADYAAPGATLAGSLTEALKIAAQASPSPEEVFIIGGAEIYQETLPAAHRLYLTEIAADFDGDAHFPEFTPQDWEEISRTPAQEPAAFPYSFAVYQRR